MSDYQVTLVNNKMNEFFIKFYGPAETPFANGVWKIHVELPEQFPYKSPSIGFMNKIFHPNIDELSGSVCLDVINQTWSPMFELINIFEIFLPQLLRYPNPADPLNGEAAALLMRDPKAYAQKVESYVERYATPEDADQACDDGDDDDDLQQMGGSGGRPRGSLPKLSGVHGGGSSNGNRSSTNGNGVGSSNGNGNGNGKTISHEEEEEDEDDEDDKMSDMGAMSDDEDGVMGEMDD